MNTLIYSLIGIFMLIVIYCFFYFCSNNYMSKHNILPHRDDDIVLIAFKTGSIAGLVYRLEVYKNGIYKFFDHDELKKTGTLDGKTNDSVKYLINKFPELKDAYCPFSGTDGLYHSLKIGNREVDFGVLNGFEQCLPNDINDNFRRLSELMN